MKGIDSPGPSYRIETEKLKQIVAKYKNAKTPRIIKVNLPNPERIRKNFKNEKSKLIKIEKSSSTEQFRTILPRQSTTVFGKDKKKSIFEPKGKNPGPGK